MSEQKASLINNRKTEDVPPEHLTVAAIRSNHEAFERAFSSGGGYKGYEVQCVGVLLARIDELESNNVSKARVNRYDACRQFRMKHMAVQITEPSPEDYFIAGAEWERTAPETDEAPIYTKDLPPLDEHLAQVDLVTAKLKAAFDLGPVLCGFCERECNDDADGIRTCCQQGKEFDQRIYVGKSTDKGAATPTCQHDLLKPDTTIEVIDAWKAKCKVCIDFFDLPGRPVNTGGSQS